MKWSEATILKREQLEDEISRIIQAVEYNSYGIEGVRLQLTHLQNCMRHTLSKLMMFAAGDADDYM